MCSLSNIQGIKLSIFEYDLALDIVKLNLVSSQVEVAPALVV